MTYVGTNVIYELQVWREETYWQIKYVRFFSGGHIYYVYHGNACIVFCIAYFCFVDNNLHRISNRSYFQHLLQSEREIWTKIILQVINVYVSWWLDEMIRGTDALQTRRNSTRLACLLRNRRHSHFWRKASCGIGNVTSVPWEREWDITEKFSIMGMIFNPAMRKATGSLYKLNTSEHTHHSHCCKLLSSKV